MRIVSERSIGMSISWGSYRLPAHPGTERSGPSTDVLEHRFRHLEQKLDHLALLCQAQWELMRDNTALTEADIQAKAQEIDLRDGQADGKMGSSRRPCSNCQRVLHQRHDHCLYCGAAARESAHRFQV
jgi:hypothetical protein